MTDLISIRLLSQQLISQQFSDPAELVSYMGAIQAQEYRQMRWAVAMRTKKPSMKKFKEAFDNGRIIRTHLMRGTWQLVSGKDYPWMLNLCSAKARSVINGWMHANGIDLPQKEQETVREIISGLGERVKSFTKEDVAEALVQNGIVMDDHRMSYHIRYGELNGLLCSGELHPQKATYSLASSKLGQMPQRDRDQSLSELAEKYFQSRSPASFEDFVWWSGLNIGDCRRAVDILGQRLERTEHNGKSFYILDNCRRRSCRKGSCLLIPSYDEYLIAYKSRDLVLAPEHSHYAHNRTGNFNPIVASDGIICGNWAPFKKEPDLHFFSESSNDFQKEWERYKGFLANG